MKKFFTCLSISVFGCISAQQNIFFDRAFWKSEPSVEVVKQKISEGNDPTSFNSAAFDATSLAILNGAPYQTIVYLLSIEGNQVNKITHDKRTYLFWAGMQSNIPIAKYLIDKGADVNVKDDKFATPILFAAARGNTNTQFYDLLIENGANIKETNGQGANALLLSLPHFNHLAQADYFIKKGLSLKSVDKNGNNAIFYASYNGNKDIVNQLIRKKINVKALNKKAENVMFAAAEGARNKQNNVDFFIFLEKLGINPNQKNTHGLTPLFVVSAKNKDANVISYFIKKGNEVNQTNQKGNTPLINASLKNTLEVITLLVNANADVNAKNEEGFSPLTQAVMGNSASVVSYLLQKGADVKVKDIKGNSLAYYLVDSYKPNDEDFDQKWKLLTENGLDFTENQSQRNNLYHLAVGKASIQLLKKIMTTPIDINAKNDDGLTPLHKAVMTAKNTQLISFLVDNGADKSIHTDFGESVYELAQENEALKGKDINFLK